MCSLLTWCLVRRLVEAFTPLFSSFGSAFWSHFEVFPKEERKLADFIHHYFLPDFLHLPRAGTTVDTRYHYQRWYFCCGHCPLNINSTSLGTSFVLLVVHSQHQNSTQHKVLNKCLWNEWMDPNFPKFVLLKTSSKRWVGVYHNDSCIRHEMVPQLVN